MSKTPKHLTQSKNEIKKEPKHESQKEPKHENQKQQPKHENQKQTKHEDQKELKHESQKQTKHESPKQPKGQSKKQPKHDMQAQIKTEPNLGKSLIKTNKEPNITLEEIKIREKCKIDLFICLLYAIIIEIYFAILNLVNLKTANFDIYIKSSYMLLILISIIMFEISYRKSSKKLLIKGIEFLVLAIHILLLERTITFFSGHEPIYILLTSIIWPIYYALKAVIIQTKESRRRLKQISDIPEIVKEEKPTKKVAKKRKK